MNVTITFANKVESYYTRADGSAALSKDVLELNADGSAAVLWSRLEFDRGGGDDGTKPRTERGFSREVLRLPPAAALGRGGTRPRRQPGRVLDPRRPALRRGRGRDRRQARVPVLNLPPR